MLLDFEHESELCFCLSSTLNRGRERKTERGKREKERVEREKRLKEKAERGQRA